MGDAAIPETLKDQIFSGYRGNHPNTVILLETLTPASLGALLAIYEHKVFVQSVLWGLNPFDQPGVELGKKLASSLYETLVKPEPQLNRVYSGRVDDAGTRQLLGRLQASVF